MRYPKFLQDGGRIGFIAPSYGATTEPYVSRFASAISEFKQMGYETVLGPNCYKSDGCGKSTNAHDCGMEAMEFFTSDCCDVIISCGGGETMCEDLEYMDFAQLAVAEPKWYMGYSDNTNFVLTLPTLADTAAIYGPCAGSFGMHDWHPAIDDAFAVLKGEKLELSNYGGWELEGRDEDPLASYNCTQKFNARALMGGKPIDKLSASGRLLGGCLDCMTILCGTKFDKVREFNERYKADGTLWFIEACELNPMGVRRCLWQLRQAGWFDTAKGFIFGRPMLYNETFGDLTYEKAILDIVGDMDVPIILDIDLGHLPPMMPIIAGAIGKATYQSGEFDIAMSLE